MKFILKDYQDEAVRDVLVNLRKARSRWHNEGELNAFSLTAPTGAGKTVMAAAAFEALLDGLAIAPQETVRRPPRRRLQ